MMRLNLAALLLMGGILLLSPILGAQAFDNKAPITAGELLHINVHKHADLTVTTQVNEAGTVNLNYIGRVSVVGLTEKEASDRVAQAYKSLLKNPRVKVSRSGSGGGGFAPRTEEMDTKVLALQNSSAESLFNALSGMATAGGSVNYDEDSNALILTDTPMTLQKMLQVVQELDQMQSQVTQVRIEARIAEVESDAAKEIGVRWFAQGDHLNTGYYPGGRQDAKLSTIRGNGNPIYNELIRQGTGGSRGSSREFEEESSINRRLNIPLHIPAPGQYFMGYVNSGIDFGTMLDALAAENKAEMLASPYTLTVNHKQATIMMTEQFPYLESGPTGAGGNFTSTSFLDVGIILEVTPHVRRTIDGATYVQMELQPEVSTASGSSNGIPIRSVRGTKQVANVLDRQTLIIGGIAQSDSRNVLQKVPGLGDMPLIKHLFRHRERTKTETELMIFITPTVFNHPRDVAWNRAIDMPELMPDGDIGRSLERSAEARKE
jgi:type II secretory pathway component GspD/PulD (secretin)